MLQPVSTTLHLSQVEKHQFKLHIHIVIAQFIHPLCKFAHYLAHACS